MFPHLDFPFQLMDFSAQRDLREGDPISPSICAIVRGGPKLDAYSGR